MKSRQPFLFESLFPMLVSSGLILKLPRRILVVLFALCSVTQIHADQQLLKKHCGKCHSGVEPKGDFRIADLGSAATKDNLDQWITSLDRVEAREMPPAKKSSLGPDERKALTRFLNEKIRKYSEGSVQSFRVSPRRLNNREFANSVRDVLLIEDIGTHLPTDNLVGDSLHQGFDTHGATLGFSSFHLEQYIESLRKIVDATILSGPRPEPSRFEIAPTQIFAAHTKQNTKRPDRQGKPDGFDFLDPKQLAYFKPFKTVPETGWYKITIKCVAMDRGRYDSEKTGIYDADPIRLSVLMGDRQKTFDVSDDQPMTIELKQWLAKGTRLRLRYPTDGLTLRGNGNFKFQNAIAGEYIKEHDPELYRKVAAAIVHKPGRRVLKPSSWHHWVDYWQGPRPRILGATVEGPFYETWPPARQRRLLGENPKAEDAEKILMPIAERAFRRRVRDGELDRIVQLVRNRKRDLGDVEALKEGIVAILTSPPFLVLNTDDLTEKDRFVAKFSCFLQSTIPDPELKRKVASGELDSFEGIRQEVQARLASSRCEPFLREFPFGWLKLNDINFMAPDPDRYRFYHRKRVSDDMVDEALGFFRHIADQNLPITEFISADYSFVNADLAEVYGIDDVPRDSRFRKYTFADGRRGGLLGMGAFLTVTADSLGTSPIHRAKYVMQNFLGIHPTPPPASVKIEEPDVRSARTIKEVLEAHRSNESCAACHRRIDPFGYAFESFDPIGAWRDGYEVPMTNSKPGEKKKGKGRSEGIPVDSSATFLDGTKYHDIVGFRKLMQTPVNRDRFVRCFVTKLLTYANGEEPDNYAEIQKIVRKSAEHDYRFVETLAAVIDSPLFREVVR